MRFLRNLVSEAPPAIAADAARLWRALQAIAVLPARFFDRNWTFNTHPFQELRSTSKGVVLDLRCISWTLHTSLDKVVRISTLGYLTSVLRLAEFAPSLVVECFNIFIGSISVNDEGVEITPQGPEQLATASARCFYRAFHRLTVMEPTSRVLGTIRRHYLTDFPHWIDFAGLPSYHTITMIRALIRRDWSLHPTWSGSDRPLDHEHILFARDIAELAQVEYQQLQKVPNWILGFTFDSLSLDPPPSASTVANCLKVGAIHLGCDVSDVATSGKRCVCLILFCVHLLTES